MLCLREMQVLLTSGHGRLSRLLILKNVVREFTLVDLLRDRLASTLHGQLGILPCADWFCLLVKVVGRIHVPAMSNPIKVAKTAIKMSEVRRP